MAAFLNACRFNPAAGGTTDWTYSSPVPGYQPPAAAGAVNGRSYKYRAESVDLSQWELGEGAYNSGTGTFARTAVLFNSSGTTTKINFSTVPQVAIVALREDLPGLTEPNTFTDTTEATGVGTTAAQIISGGVEVLKRLFVAGIAAFTSATASTSTATGAVVVSGGVGVGGAGWFGGLVRTAGGFVSSVSPASAAALDTSAATPFLIANGGSQALATGIYGLLIVVDATNGYSSVYLLNGGSATTVTLSGTWVAATTTPAAGKLSVAWNGGGYSIYSNFGSTVTVKVTGIKTA
ncbi:hypothetical protein [Bradyrhizobium sp.]|uniref:hypothetical protein n=1 Tax=Bradyrhizobium sp. TaxID=376 RepID=UPI002737005C|nr:hypothetical protein [Bradyrhizobium sp.]MDP3076643.1 hypothetical protein [Bradyrhizobium sp.]